MLARQRPLILAVDLGETPAGCVHIDLPEIAAPAPVLPPARRPDRDRDRDLGPAFHPTFGGIDTRTVRRPSLSSSLPGSAEDSLPRSRSRSPHSSPNTPYSADSPWRRLEVNEAMPTSYTGGGGLSPRRLSVSSAAPLQPIVEHDDESVLAATASSSTNRPTQHRASPSSGRSSPGSDAAATTPSAPPSASPPPSPGSLSSSSAAGRPRRAPLLRQSSLSHVTSAPDADRPAPYAVAVTAATASPSSPSSSATAAAASTHGVAGPTAGAGDGDRSPGMTRRRLTVGSTDDVVDSMRAAAIASVASLRRAPGAGPANGNTMASDADT